MNEDEKQKFLKEKRGFFNLDSVYEPLTYDVIEARDYEGENFKTFLEDFGSGCLEDKFRGCYIISAYYNGDLIAEHFVSPGSLESSENMTKIMLQSERELVRYLEKQIKKIKQCEQFQL